MSHVTIDIFSDVICPWCYIGKRRFERALDQFAQAHPDVDLDVRYRAYMLDPRAPAGESTPARDGYARKFGGYDTADAIIAKVTAEAAGEGLEFRLDRALRSNTLDAHRLLVLAAAEGCQHQLKERLMAAYFTDGLAIGDRDVLVDLAAEVGIDADAARAWLEGGSGRQEVLADLEFAMDNGISGVPNYVFDGRLSVPGAQDVELFVRVLERSLELSAQSSGE